MSRKAIIILIVLFLIGIVLAIFVFKGKSSSSGGGASGGFLGGGTSYACDCEQDPAIQKMIAEYKTASPLSKPARRAKILNACPCVNF